MIVLKDKAHNIVEMKHQIVEKDGTECMHMSNADIVVNIDLLVSICG